MASVYEYICDKVIPGCEHTHTGETDEDVRERATVHLHTHHDMGYIDDTTAVKLQEAITLLTR